jgi:hypothetical protein
MRLLSSFLALALSTSTALAADVAPLSPGVPAGVKPAQDYMLGSDNTLLFIGLGAAAIAGIALAASSGGNTPAAAVTPPVVTTTTTTTT